MGIRSMSPYENSFTDSVRMVHLVIVASCSRLHTHTHTQIRTRPPPSSSSHTRRERGGKTHTTILAMTSNMYEKVRMHLILHCQLYPIPHHNHHALHQKKEELFIHFNGSRRQASGVMSAFRCPQCGAMGIVQSGSDIFVCAECGVESAYANQVDEDGEYLPFEVEDAPLGDDEMEFDPTVQMMSGRRIRTSNRTQKEQRKSTRERKAAANEVNADDDDIDESLTVGSLACGYVQGVQELLQRACTAAGVSRQSELLGVARNVWVAHVRASRILTAEFGRLDSL